jgi:hypothetical protein
MKTLEQKDIAGYLPHELHCLNCDDMIEMIDFCNVGNLMRGIELQDEAEDDEWVASQQYKLILRPFPDLYKTITHNGKKIIPIVECAKIVLPTLEWDINSYNIVGTKLVNRHSDIWFAYDSDGFFFSALGYQMNACTNQYKLFDFLHELKIDYRGLIDASLAIDANTLEINPYK